MMVRAVVYQFDRTHNSLVRAGLHVVATAPLECLAAKPRSREAAEPRSRGAAEMPRTAAQITVRQGDARLSDMSESPAGLS